MTKTKKKSKSTIEIAQHTTTSEAVKIRPRKRLQTTATKAQPTRVQKVEEKENVAIALRPLPVANLDELFKIWDSDKRIPTVESRREWAAARNVAPQDVHRFFSRQKALAKKARWGLPKGTYTLSVGTPPVVKHEEEAPRSKPRRQLVRSDIKAEMLETPLSSDDFYVPTSETLVGLAQKEQKTVSEETKNLFPLPPSSPIELSSPAPSLDALSSILLFSPSLSHRLHAPENYPNQGWCCQNRTPSSEASLTCILCTRDIQPNNSSTSGPPFTTIDHSHAQSSPDSSSMELSALPFLYRSPDLMRRRSAVPDSTQWFFDLHLNHN